MRKPSNLFLFLTLILTLQFFSCKPTLQAPVITATAGNGDIEISWEPTTGATSYEVWSQEGTTIDQSVAVSLKPVNSPYILKGLTNGTTYTVAIKAIGTANESNLSNTITLTPAALSISIPPNFKLDGVTSVGEATFSWEKVEDIDGYVLYYKKGTMTSSAEENITSKTGITELTYKLVGLSAGESYSAIIRAYKGSGSTISYSQDSQVIPFSVPIVIDSPSDLRVSGYSQNSITLNWTAKSGATSTNLYYREDNGTTIDVENDTLTTIENVTAPYTVTGLTESTPYRFVLCSLVGTTISEPGNNVTGTPDSSGEITNAPILISVTPDVTTATLLWSIHDKAQTYELYYNEGATLDKTQALKSSFDVSAITTSSNPKIITMVSTDYIQYELSGLTADTEYTFAIKANNDGTTTPPFSNSQTKTTLTATPPDAVGTVVTSPGDSEVTLTFGAVQGATSYIAYYNSGSGTFTIAESDENSGEISPANPYPAPVSITITGLTNGTLYSFEVIAKNSNGNSALSDVVEETPAASSPDDPDRPLILNSTSKDSSVEITFTENNDNATIFRIYYAEVTSEILTDGVVDADKLKSVATTDGGIKNITKTAEADSPTTINSLTNGTEYAFVMSAINETPEPDLESELSNTVKETPEAVTTVPDQPSFFLNSGDTR